MKYQLIIILAILTATLASPIPDEEVSPGLHDLNPKSDGITKQGKKTISEVNLTYGSSVDIITTDSTNISKPIKAIDEIQQHTKIDMPAIIPDAELPQQLPHIKEKQIAETIKEGKPLTVVKVPTNVAVIETRKQIVEEVLPFVFDPLPLTDPVSETYPEEMEFLSKEYSLKSESEFTSETLPDILNADNESQSEESKESIESKEEK